MKRWHAVVIALALGLSVSFEVVTATAAPSARNVVVPRVVGMRLDVATRTLRAHGFRIVQNCGSGYECTTPKQLWVSAQSPRAGSRFPARTVITVYGALKAR